MVTKFGKDKVILNRAGLEKYLTVQQESEHCFLTADCRPSKRLRDPRHELLLYVMQKSGNIFKSPLHLHGEHGSNLVQLATCFVSKQL